MLSFPSSHSKHTTLNKTTDSLIDLNSIIDEPDFSKCDWFESFINYRSRSSSSIPSGSIIADLVRSYIQQVDTYQAQGECEVWGSVLSVVKKNMRAEFEYGSDGCAFCEAINTLRLFEAFTDIRISHPEDRIYNIDTSFLISEILQALLPVLDKGDNDALFIATSAAWILASEGRYQDVERVIQAVIQEMEHQPAWNHTEKEELTLTLAEIYVLCGRCDEAEKIVQDLFGDEYPEVAMVARTRDVEFFTEINSSPYKKYAKLTYKGRVYLNEVIGEARMAKMAIYEQAVFILQLLNRYRAVDVTDNCSGGLVRKGIWLETLK